MKKYVLSFFFALLLLNYCASAQKEKHKIFYNNAKIENNDLIVEIVDAVAEADYCKMKLKITNKTTDHIIYNPAETEFVYAFGIVYPKGALAIFNGKTEYLGPKETDTRVIIAKGDKRFLTDSCIINLKGFHKIAAKGTIYKAPDFQLPPSTNDFTVGPFKVVLKDLDKKTKKTTARFEITYTNDAKHYGVITKGQPVLKIKDGREFAMSDSKDKVVLIKDGKDASLSMEYKIQVKTGVDMQFATMHVVWRDTFSESPSEMIQFNQLTLTIDSGKTEAKK